MNERDTSQDGHQTPAGQTDEPAGGVAAASDPATGPTTGPATDPATGPAVPPTDPDEVDMSMLELLVCPLTKGPLHYDRQAQELISERAKLAYPVRGGVPVLLPSEARVLDDVPGPAR